MVQFSDVLLRKFIAPNICDFVHANIPSIEDDFPEAPYWISNHFLNNIGRSHFAAPTRLVALAYIRRSHNAFEHFHNARALTLKYLEGLDPYSPPVSRYFAAVSEWENFIIQMQMVIEIFRWINHGEPVFKVGDESTEDRIWHFANKIKHTGDSVEKGYFAECHTLPLWLTNEGLQSPSYAVSYAEAAAVLREVSLLANELQDARGLKEMRDNG